MFERVLSSEESFSVFQNTISSLNLSYRLESLSHTTRRCYLQLNSKDVEIGNGKGFGRQSELSALYEALEHYIVTCYSVENLDCHFFSLSEITDNHLPAVLPEPLKMSLVRSGSTDRLMWTTCRSIDDTTFGLFPVFLINPEYRIKKKQSDSYNYSSYIKYSSNNGTATGATFYEAGVHGMSELIERDALSVFLYSSFVLNEKKFSVIDKRTIPLHLRQLIEEVEHKYTEEIVVLEITSDINIPVFFVTFTKQRGPIQPFGTGCSLIQEYALERSILEAIQSRDLYSDQLRAQDEHILNQFANWPCYLSCAKHDILSIIKGKLPSSFCPRKHCGDLSVENIYKRLVGKLLELDIVLFYKILFQSESIYCVKFISPMLEQFHLCLHGHFSIPGERIRKMKDRAMR